MRFMIEKIGGVSDMFVLTGVFWSVLDQKLFFSL